MGRRLARTLGLALVVGLAGCAELMSSFESSPTTTAPPPRETARVSPQITTVPPEPPASGSVRRPPAPAATGNSGQSRPAVAVDPEGLLGLDASDLHRRLGTPNDVELEGPAEVWQYAVGDCLLRLYLYADIGTGARRTLRYDAAPVDGKKVDCSPPLTTTGAADGQG
jgi:hypothetical protein